MKSNVLSRVLYVLAALVIVANTVFSVINSLYPDISDLPQGEFLMTSTSPYSSAKVNFYLIKNNLGTAVRGERADSDKKDNIYWQTDIDSVSAVWVDDYGIIINDIPINIKTDKFDSRKGTAIFSEGVTAQKVLENEQK